MVLDASIAYAESADTEGFAGPRTLGDFRIGRELGRGGMGIVYEAEQVSMGRRVALKILPVAAVLDPRHVRRFKNEIQAAALLQHQNIVPIYAVGCERGIHYFAMQYVEGQTLADVIASLRGTAGGTGDRGQGAGDRGQESGDRGQGSRRNLAQYTTGSVTPSSGVRDRCRAAARLIIQAAEALDHAHQRGVLHRDVKPANLLIDATGNLWVSDFGLARLEADAGTTMTGQVVGTLRYMSPEQALAKRAVVDQRADIYSLGATLYELCALQPAYLPDDRQELLRQIAFDMPQRLRTLDPAIPRELDTVALKALEKDPADRYQTAQEMADDLRRYLDDRPILARPPSPAERVRKWAARNRKTAVVSAAAVLIALLTSLAAVAFHSSRVSEANRSLHALNRALVASRDKTRELLYLADMQLAFQAWDRRHFIELQRLLDRHKPQPGETDVRAMEWHLLSSLAKPPQPVVFLGHDGPVREMALVPGKEEFVSVGDDGTIRHWSIREERLLRTIKTGAKQLHAVAISPDGKWLATGNPTLELWDFAAGEKVRDLSRIEYTLESIAFAPDGESVAGGWRYDEVRVVALDGEEIAHLPPTGRRNETLAFSRDGQTLLVPVEGEEGSVLRQWNIHAPCQWSDLGDWGASSPAWQRLTLSHNGAVSAAASLSGGTVHLIENQTDRRIGTLAYSADITRTLSFAPHDDGLAWGSDDGTLSVAVLPRAWQSEGLARLQQVVPHAIDAHACKITDLEYLSGDRILTCSEDGSIKLWYLLETVVSTPVTLPKADGFAYSPDGEQMAAPCADGSIWLGRSADGCQIESIKIGDESLNALAFLPDGSRIVVGDNDGMLTVWDRKERRVAARWKNPNPASVRALAVAPNGDQVVSSTADQLLRIHNAQSLSVIETISAPANVRALDFSPDGRTLAWGGDFSDLFLHETAGWTETRRIPAKSASCACVAFANVQDFLASGHENGSIQLMDCREGRVLQRFASSSPVDSLAWSPDDRLLISSHQDGTQRVWHVATATELGVLHRGGTYGTTRFSPDGRRLATISERSQGILWKLSD